jgi:hypothetical protein
VTIPLPEFRPVLAVPGMLVTVRKAEAILAHRVDGPAAPAAAQTIVRRQLAVAKRARLDGT